MGEGNSLKREVGTGIEQIYGTPSTKGKVFSVSGEREKRRGFLACSTVCVLYNCPSISINEVRERTHAHDQRHSFLPGYAIRQGEGIDYPGRIRTELRFLFQNKKKTGERTMENVLYNEKNTIDLCRSEVNSLFT